ncbi:hypothetical protein Tco_0048333, partial [Tanacetum coccineum]
MSSNPNSWCKADARSTDFVGAKRMLVPRTSEEDEDNENFNLFPTMKELSYHEWLLKNPRPPWVKARIRAE